MYLTKRTGLSDICIHLLFTEQVAKKINKYIRLMKLNNKKELNYKTSTM